MSAFRLHRWHSVFRYRIMAFTRVFVTTQIGRVIVIPKVHINAGIDECGRRFEMQTSAFRQRSVRLTRCQNLRGIQRLKIILANGESVVPGVMINCNYILRLVRIAVLGCKTYAVLNGVGAVCRSETVVDIIVISGIVIHPHRAAVVVLVKTTCVVTDRQTVMNQDLMVRTLSTHLKSVSVA